MKIVLVRWVDSVSNNDWASFDLIEQAKTKEIYSAGFLLHEGKDKVTVMLCTPIEGGVGSCWMDIPASSVKSIKELGEVELENADI